MKIPDDFTRPGPREILILFRILRTRKRGSHSGNISRHPFRRKTETTGCKEETKKHLTNIKPRTMKKILLLTAVLLLTAALPAREKRNFLTGSCSEQELVRLLAEGHNWIPYPAYRNREGWNRLAPALREKYVRNGEKYLGYEWPAVKATEYLEFSRSGNRVIMERPQNERMNALRTLTMAELAEGKGRFLDDLINGVFSFCEQTYWGLSAHFYMYREDERPSDGNPTTNLPDIDNPIIDLWVGEVAADLAWVWYFFHDEFDRISPVISRRLERELRTKVLEPFYTRNDYWWITGWKKGIANNWNPWCNFNVMNCVLLLEKDPVKKAKAVYKTMTSVDLFYNVYPDDGACEEGPSYWSAAGGKAFDYLNLLSRATGGGIDLFDRPLVRDIGRYIYRVYISQGHFFTNFADAPPVIGQRGGTIWRYGQRIGDETMQGFGAFLLNRSGFGQQPVMGPLALVMEDLFGLEGWNETRPVEPLIGEFYFPDMQIAVARNKAGTNEGFYLAAKGGNNGEGHNHNDVGSCIVFYDGNPVLVDAGVGTYTKETFTGNRYKIWTMQSAYHNLPVINGTQQSPGGRFRAADPRYEATPSSVSFSADIAGAYPEEARVERWIRSYRLERDKGIRISDRYRLKEITGTTELHFLTPLECSVVRPGLLELKGPHFRVHLSYKPAQLAASIERIPIDDSRLQRAWGDRLYRLVLKATERKSGELTLDLRATG